METPSNSHEVFLSHASSDKPVVERIALRLQEKGVTVWLDKWNLVAGEPWQPAIEEALKSCGSVAVFIGPKGLASWHNEEMRAAIQCRVSETHARVIPVLLPAAKPEDRSKLPLFLKATTWVEFRTEDDEEAIRNLICGIRGIAPGSARTGAIPSPQEPSRFTAIIGLSGSGLRRALMLGGALAAAALVAIGILWSRSPVGPASAAVAGTQAGQAAVSPAPLPPAQPATVGASRSGTVVQTAAANGPDASVTVGKMNVKRNGSGDTMQEAKATNGGTVDVGEMNYDDTGASGIAR